MPRLAEVQVKGHPPISGGFLELVEDGFLSWKVEVPWLGVWIGDRVFVQMRDAEWVYFGYALMKEMGSGQALLLGHGLLFRLPREIEP